MSHYDENNLTTAILVETGEEIKVTKFPGNQENRYEAEDGTVYLQDAVGLGLYVDGDPSFPLSPEYLKEHDEELRAAAAEEAELEETEEAVEVTAAEEADFENEGGRARDESGRFV